MTFKILKIFYIFYLNNNVISDGFPYTDVKLLLQDVTLPLIIQNLASGRKLINSLLWLFTFLSITLSD